MSAKINAKLQEFKAGAAAMVGLAVVRKSADPTWPRWACVFPDDRKTKWFSHFEAAQREADKFNGR